MTTTDCIGCRAAKGAPRCADDDFPAEGSPPPGFGWEVFECATCGIKDTRLVNAAREAMRRETP